MKKFSLLFICCLTALGLTHGCKNQASQTYDGIAVSEIEKELTSLLQTFYPRIVDTVNGGYWTNFENDWTLSENQQKMLVTQARGLWTAARAAEMFPENTNYREAAAHGYRFLISHMWDSINGGFYQYYYPEIAKPEFSFKLAYGNAFALYGLAQYAKINKDPQVILWVKKTFDWLDASFHDSVNKGYFNILVPENLPDRAKAFERAGWGESGWKDQNTSIHLMEAFTAVYQILPEVRIKNRLVEMLELIRDSMTTDEGYLNLFFNEKWQPLSNHDSSKAYITNNPGKDHISFGHNIETAYLMIDASHTLYGTPDSLTLAVALKMMDHTMTHGFDLGYYGLYDKGYRFGNINEVEIIDSTKVWWAQAEAWHALALFSDLYPENPEYKTAFKSMWKYIMKEVIDHQKGGWYNSGLDKNPRTVYEKKAHAWKSCYHDGRALMQVMVYAGDQKE